ncbi:TonB-dependent receptor domain-containing protein [Vulcaniibacterium tengchongense]|uniref:TonB-dependent receptor-like protein n=1 Tax=Vulcaniibacterium tengchongense TaxID=1273429 RepID=A0A3N4UXI6_9GAMM|nr:TonB-dependent receptor [Vulcaniibacterium tengchongense]RPE74838.1 TonB-dependent receptor-like protein [Vulcaniibacterium tengchongense]
MTHSTLHRNALASALALALLAPLAQAQDTSAGPANDDPVTQVDTVTVTGSRIRRTEIEGPAPVQILTAEQIKAEGFVTVHDALSTLTEAIGTVEADVSWGSHTPNASPLNLRNMGPNRSLLLVNGRRVADYPLPYGGQSNFANYANIPAAAVERIEVLTGGASAIYGSDAIAGVINVILKQNYDGDQVRVRGGTSTEGGRDTWDLSWAGGKTGDRWSLTYALQWTKRDPLFGRDRPEMDDADDAPYSSWNPEQRKVGFRPTNGLSLIDLGTGERLAPPAGACERFRGEYYRADRLTYNYDTDTIRNTGQLCGMSADYANWLLASGSESWSGYLHGTWDFENGTRAWVNLALHDAKADWSTSTPYVSTDELVGGDGAFFDPQVGRANLLAVRQFTGFEVGGQDKLYNRNKEQSWDLSAGLGGTFADGRFNWDASIGRSRYTVHERIAVVDWDMARDYFLGPQLGVDAASGQPIYALNQERWWNPVTPEQYRQLGGMHSINEAASWVNQAAFSVSGDLFEGWAGPIGFAAILEAAKQGYELNPDPRGNLDYYVQNIDRGGGERTRYSAGVEFKVPLLQSVTLTAAARRDRYGDYEAFDDENRLAIGSQSETTWNAGLEWRPTRNLLLRGTYATSFHAPDMHYLLAAPSSAEQRVLDPFRCIDSGAYLNNNCVADNTEVFYPFDVNRRGTPDLQSELGESWTVGFVWDVMDNLSLTADYWSIDLDDEIRDLPLETILRDEAGCRTGLTIDPAVAWSNPGGAEYCATIESRVARDAQGRIVAVETGPINIAQKHVAGIDASLRYRLDTARWGNFVFGLNYTNLRSFKEQLYATDPNPERRDREIRSKVRGSVSWQGEKWNWTVYADRIGAVPGVRYHWGADRLDNPGGCRPFPDGYVPSDSLDGNCSVPADSGNPNAGQSTGRYFGRIGPAIVWNFNVGYRLTENARINFYVNNAFNSTGWNHKDPYKLDYEFYNSRLFNPIGREWAMEYVFDF